MQIKINGWKEEQGEDRTYLEEETIDVEEFDADRISFFTYVRSTGYNKVVISKKDLHKLLRVFE